MQGYFFDQEGIAELRPLGGASGGFLLDWFNHGYYAAKSYSTQRPYTLISEWLCADIASHLSLPMPAREIIPYKGKKWLGFEWRGDPKSFSPGMENKLLNRDVVSGMLALDVLICNRDRHAGNMVFQCPSPGAGYYTCFLIDHSHALIGDLENLDALTHWILRYPDPEAFLQVAPPQLRALICSIEEFSPWLKKIEAISRYQLEESVARIPLEWKPQPDDTVSLIGFLMERKDRIRELLSSGQSCFSALAGG